MLRGMNHWLPALTSFMSDATIQVISFNPEILECEYSMNGLEQMKKKQ
jgi:hypothetical protein